MISCAEATEPVLQFKLKIRVYGKSTNSTESHSYLVDDMSTGTSSCVGELNINIRKVTFKQLRPMVQYNRSGHMDKRSLIFQEALFIMGRLPNYFNRPACELNQYQFGFMKKTDKLDMRIVDISKEDMCISDFIGTTEIFAFDLMIVPLSQISPLLLSPGLT